MSTVNIGLLIIWKGFLLISGMVASAVLFIYIVGAISYSVDIAMSASSLTLTRLPVLVATFAVEFLAVVVVGWQLLKIRNKYSARM
jgi:hypothetical protein